jgi:hypothetical protein
MKQEEKRLQGRKVTITYTNSGITLLNCMKNIIINKNYK